MFDNAFNLVLIVVGFGLVIVVHELGHFLAAKWAGIRVHAFAVGFGQAVCSFRKGMGLRAGSSEAEYVKRLKANGEHPERGQLEGVSPTEYRLNWIPFGGYVKMLGQEDMDPSARSSAPDAYNNQSVGKRLVVISAGVVMNVILAAVLFVIVFSAGMRTPPAIVGDVLPGGPASKAGVLPGDVIRTVNGHEVDQFAELSMITAMTPRGRSVELTVQRAGEAEPVSITITPARDEASKLMQLGLYSASSNTVWEAEDERVIEQLRSELDGLGFAGVELGATLVAVNGEAVEPVAATPYADVLTADALREAILASGGEVISATFENPGGASVTVRSEPRPKFQTASVALSETTIQDVDHLLGLAPVMGVGGLSAGGEGSGLREGDVFVRIGDAAWPNVAEGISQIRAHTGRAVRMTVLRDGERVDLEAPVDHTGRVGFGPEARFDLNLVSSVPTPSEGGALPASRLTPSPISGSRVIGAYNKADPFGYGDVRTSSFGELRREMLHETAEAFASGEGATLMLVFEVDGALGDEPSIETAELTLTHGEIETLHALGWDPSPHLAVFSSSTYLRQAQNPLEAVTMGVGATRDMLVRTYITFLRLFDGTVRVEHLRGPVGIADVGVQFASQGIIYLLYFLALISANLAVINFLPVPFVDGGHAVFLLIEGITRKPVPVAVQNVATLAGLLAIMAVFLVVTFNDITRLFG